MTTTTTTRRLSDDAISRIRNRHFGHSVEGHSEEIAYRADDGHRVGPLASPEATAQAHRFVVISSEHTPSVEELREVEVAADGTVHQPASLRSREPWVSRVLDGDPTPPESASAAPPAPVTVRPLGEHVASRILTLHASRVPRSVSEPGVGNRRPGLQAFETLLYDPRDGRLVGSLANPDHAPHAPRCVRISTSRLPTVSELLAEVEVASDGEVRQ